MQRVKLRIIHLWYYVNSHCEGMLKYGKDSIKSTQQPLKEICRDLHCQRDRYTWTSHPALEGTNCGESKVRSITITYQTRISRESVILISIAVVSKWRLCAPDDDYWNVTAIHATSAHRWTDTARQIEFDWRSKVWKFDETGVSRQPGEFYGWLLENSVPSNDLNSIERFRRRFGTTGAMLANVNRVVCTVSLDDFVTAAPAWKRFGERVVNTGMHTIALEGQERCQFMLIFDFRYSRKKCYGPDKKYEACTPKQVCNGIARIYFDWNNSFSHRFQCYNVPRITLSEFGNQICERAKKFDSNIRDQGIQKISNDPEESCKVYCATKSGEPITKSWTYPDGTMCQNQESNSGDNYFCVNGRCEVRLPLLSATRFEL